MNEGLTLDQQAHEEQQRERSRSLLFWLLWAIVVFLILFGCGQIAMRIEGQQAPVEIRPALQANYGVWSDTVQFGAINPGLMDEIRRDRGSGFSFSNPRSGSCFLPGSCSSLTPTASPFPSLTATVTNTATITRTPTTTSSPTNTPLPTFTPTPTSTPAPPTNTPTPTPIVWPLKLVNPNNVDPGGDTVTVNILVVNYGNLTGAELTRVTDRLPAGMTFIPGSCSMSPGPVVPCVAIGNEVSWSFSPARIIDHTRFVTFTFRANVSGIAAGDVLTNLAETQGDNFETATYVRRVYAYTPTPTSTPITVPNADPDSYTTTEDLPRIVVAPGVLENDSDAVWDTLTASLNSPPAHGSVVVQLDGGFTYTPDADYYGTDSFTYDACDGGGACDTATVSISIDPSPDPPRAQDDLYSLNEDQSLSVAAVGVLVNDVDPDNLLPPGWTGLIVNTSPLAGPHHAASAPGSFALFIDGAFDYTPQADYNGPDQFSYQVCDTPPPGSCDVATVYITVTSINDPPVASDDSAVTDEDVAVTIDVLGNDSDIQDGDPLSIFSVTQGSNGVVTHTVNDVSYTPDLHWFGTDSFTYTISDGNGGFATASVLVAVSSVNDDPVAVDDPWPAAPPILIGQGGSITVDVWANDYEDPVEGDTLYVSSIVSPPVSGGLSVATIDDAGSPGYLEDDHSIIYTPDPAFHHPTAPDTFVYELSDGVGGTDQATVSIMVNDAPLASDDVYTMDEDTVLTSDAASGVILAGPIPDSDPNGDPLTAVLASGPANAAAFTMNPDGSFSYQPALHYFGGDSFTYYVTDGGLDSAPARVDISVNPINDAPVASPDGIRTNMNTPVDIDVLANDSDLDLDPLIIENVTAPPSRVTNNSTYLTFIPQTAFTGFYPFTYDACDRPTGDPDQLCDTASVTVFVSGPPNAVPDSYMTSEDTTLVRNASQGVLANDGDLDGDPLTAVLVSGPTHAAAFTFNANGSFSYTPAANFNSPPDDEFTYQACDPGGAPPQPQLCDTATVSITVNPANDPPTAVDDGTTIDEDVTTDIDVVDNDYDIDGLIDPATVQVISPPSHGSAVPNGDGTVRYDPDWNYTGIDSFTYTVDDDLGASSNIATVTVNVQPVNDAPIALEDAYSTGQRTYMEMSSLNVDAAYGVLANDTEPDGEAMTVTNMTTPPHHTSWATLPWQWGTDGSFRYTPLYDFHGLDSFTYTVCDPTPLCDTTTVHIAVNDPPEAEDDSYNTDEDTQLSVSAPGVLDNDSDPNMTPPADVISASLSSGPSHGSVSLNPDGSFIYDPDPHYHGSDSFFYQACDQGVAPIQGPLCAGAEVVLTVNPVNDPPIAVDDSMRTNEGAPRTLDVLFNDYEDPIEGDTLFVSAITQASDGVVSFTPNDVTYTPDPSFYGPDSFTYTISDGLGGFDTAVVSVFVSTTPSALDDPGYSTQQDATLTVASPGVLSNDSDPDGDGLQANLTNSPDHAASFSLAPNGSFSYTPDLYFYGTDTFTYEACDPGSSPQPPLCASAHVTITIQNVEDSPIARDDAYTLDEDGSLLEDRPGGPGLLTNDSDPDNLPPFVPPGYVPWTGLTVSTLPVVAPDHGDLNLYSNGSFEYVPDPDYAGSDGFTYEVCDAGMACAAANVDLTITAYNDPPVAVNDAQSTNEDTAASIPVLANDSDPDPGDVLSIDSVTHGAHGSVAINGTSVVYTPNSNWFGEDTFAYTITDGNGEFASASVTVTVQSVNDNPLAHDDSDSAGGGEIRVIDVLDNDVDIENDPLTVDSVSASTQGGLVTNNGMDVTYNPNGYSSPTVPDTFTYRAIDSNGGMSNSATVSILVNDPPVAISDAFSTDEDTQLDVSAPGILQNDHDPNGDPLYLSLLSDVTHGSLLLNADGSFIYQPAANYFGIDAFTYRICDAPSGGMCVSVGVNLTINAVNDAPMALNDSASTNQANALSGSWSIPVAANDTDIEGPLNLDSIVIVSAPSNGSAIPNPSVPGEIIYTLNDGRSTEDSFAYTIRDADGAVSNSATVSIIIERPEMQIDKAAVPEAIMVGEVVDFYITVWNNGPGIAYDVYLNDQLGSCFRWLSGENPDGLLGNFNEGDAVVVVARARLDSGSGCDMTNRATVSSTNGIDDSVEISVGLLAPIGGTGALPTPTPTPTPAGMTLPTGSGAEVEAAFTLLVPVFLLAAPFVFTFFDRVKGRP